MNSKGRAELVVREKVIDEDGDIIELAIWSVPLSPKQPAGVRYRLAFIRRDAADPAVLYDNHHPKGHHRHVEGVEGPYDFATSRSCSRTSRRTFRESRERAHD